MPGQKGNPGGGRKTALIEAEHGQFLINSFFTKHEIINKYGKKVKISGQDIFLKKLLVEENERILITVLNKIFPNLEIKEQTGDIKITFDDNGIHLIQSTRSTKAST